MLDIAELRRAIAEIESRDPSLSNCAKLADLYTVVDHMHTGDYERSYSRDSGSRESIRVGAFGDSVFLRAVAGKNSAQAWAIMDELMESLQVVNPRVYDSVLRKIDAIN